MDWGKLILVFKVSEYLIRSQVFNTIIEKSLTFNPISLKIN